MATKAVYKNISIKKRGGGTRTQRVKVLKSGKYKFVKNKTIASKVSKTKSKSKRRKSMAKKKSRKKRSVKIPMALTSGFAATMLGSGPGAPAGQTTIDHLVNKDWQGALNRICANWTGYDPGQGKFSLDFLNIWPLVIGASVSWAASKFGINKRLQGIPLVKI